MRIKLNNSGVGSRDIDPAGGTIAAPLKLLGNPSSPMEAVTSAYVESVASSFSGSSVTGVFAAARLPAFTGAELSSAGNGIFTLNNTGVAAGTYAKVTVDAKGRVTGNGVLVSGDIPNLSYTKLVDRPTTLAGYGITDVVSLSGGVMTGALSLNAVASDSTHLVNKGYVDTRVGGSGGSAFVTGDVVSKGSSITPAGFLRCNGGVVSRTIYAGLFSVIGTKYNNIYLNPGSGKPWVHQYEINDTSDITLTSNWINAGITPIFMRETQALVTKDRVFLVGGASNGNVVHNKVLTAVINADGSLGTWTYSGDLPFEQHHGSLVVTKNRVYYIGGDNNTAIYATYRVFTAPINTDGTLGTWTLTTGLPTSQSRGFAFTTSSRVYYLSGVTEVDGGVGGGVFSAPINLDGTIGSWVTSQQVGAFNASSGVIVTKNYVYYLVQNNMPFYRATIDANGVVGTFTANIALPTNISSCSLVAVNKRVYLIGNGHANNNIYSYPINPDGTLGSWRVDTAFTTRVGSNAPFVVKDRLYLYVDVEGTDIVNKIIYHEFPGGANDYSPFYTGTFATMSDTTFKIPDTTLDDAPGFFSYIKF